MKSNLLYLDSNVIIAALSSKEKHSQVAQNLLRRIVSGEYQAIASSIVYSEVFGVARVSVTKNPDLLAFFSQFKNFEAVTADDAICIMAGELRRQHGPSLRLPDAIHLATALSRSVSLFVTEDSGLSRIAKDLLPTKKLSEL